MAGQQYPANECPLPLRRHGPGAGNKRRTFEGRETAIEQQLEIAEMPLGEGNRGEGVGLGGELGPAGQVAGHQVLEDSAVGIERHLDKGCRLANLDRQWVV